ncbi:MAG: glycosyltransferase [Pseudolabrys sp.]|nr:glycosyltransferase [Pseudolabrys sp.]
MKILHVLPVYWPAVRYGGPVFAVHGLCRALAARGHDVAVMTTNVDGPGVSEVPLDRPLWRDGVKIDYFASPFLRRVFWAPSLARALRAELAAFDLVHLHTIYQWPVWVAARQARALRVPYVISPRGMLVKELIRRRNRLVKTLWLELVGRRSLAHAAAIQATSDVEAAELARFGWTLPPVVTIPNGVDDPEPVPALQAVAPDVLAATAGGPAVLYVGRLSWKKGLERLLQAFARTPSGTLVIAGTDDEGLAARLSVLAAELRIGARVRIVPRTVSGVDKEHLFAAARLFVLPSYSENFGNTVLEAMRRGVAVVPVPEVGAAAIVQRAQAGIVTAGDPEPLSIAMARLWGDPALARAMGASGARYVGERYGWPRIAERMERFYRDLMP